MDFFDKMKDGLSKGIDTIGTKGKELMEETQVQLQISSLRGKRREALEQLGSLAHDLFKKGALVDEGAKVVCAGIDSLDQQIAAKQAELRHESGAAVSAPAAGPAPAPAQCECGAENTAGVKFCPACGKKIG